MYNCTFLNECYLCISQGFLGKREFLPQAKFLKRLLVPVCSHRAFARLCRSVFFSLGGCNLKNLDKVCMTPTSFTDSLSFCSQNLPSVLWSESVSATLQGPLDHQACTQRHRIPQGTWGRVSRHWGLRHTWAPHAIYSCRSNLLGIKILPQHFPKNASEFALWGRITEQLVKKCLQDYYVFYFK